MQNIKCVLVGDENVGKSCMISTYVNNKFPHEHIPTGLGNFILQNVEVDGEEFDLGIQDTPGAEDFDRLRYICYPGTDVFIICFSLISPTSFANVESKWLPEVRRIRPSTPIILVGNKLELRYQLNIENIKIDEGEEIAKKIGAVEYLECSAFTKKGVKKVFETAARVGCKLEPPKKSKRRILNSTANFLGKVKKSVRKPKSDS